MFTKVFYIGFANAFALVLGIAFNKILALYFPYEYVGYMGLIKSYASTAMNIILLGVNYSYFFLHRTYVDEGNMDNKLLMSKAFILIGINILLAMTFLLIWSILFEKNIFIICALSVAVILSLNIISTQNDAIHNNFVRYPYYLGAQSLTLLLGAGISLRFELELINAIIYTALTIIALQVIYISFKYLRRTIPKAYQNLTLFFRENIKYSKFFFIQVVLNSLIFATIQFTVSQYQGSFLTQFNTYIQLASYLTVAGTVFGTYLFPKLVKDSEATVQYKMTYLAFGVLASMSIIILTFFNEVVTILYKSNFVPLNILFFLIINAKLLEIVNATQSIRFQSELRFRFLYSVIALSNAPIMVYISLVYFSKTTFNELLFVSLYFTAFAIQFILYGFSNRQSLGKYFIILFGYLIFFLFTKGIFIDV